MHKLGENTMYLWNAEKRKFKETLSEPKSQD